MFGKPKVAQFDVVIAIQEHVVGFDVSMNDSMSMEIGYNSSHLGCDSSKVIFCKVSPSFMDQIEKSPFFDQLHSQAKSRRLGYGTDHEHDIRVTIFGQHIDFVIELF